MLRIGRRTFFGLAGAASLSASEPQTSRLRGPYLGQNPPGATPELFAPGVVNTGLYTRDITMAPDGTEFYFRVNLAGFSRSAIVVSRLQDGVWSAPEVAPFAADPRWRTLEPCVAPDGKQFFFVSDRPEDPKVIKPGPMGIWVMDRVASGWSEPRRLGPPVNGKLESYFPSVTLDGTLYFCTDDPEGPGAMMRARRQEGAYHTAEKLPAQVNCGKNRYNAFAAADESFMIVPAMGLPDSRGGFDYYITFRRPDDVWSEPVNLGDAVNSAAGAELSAFVSRDGKYLFFSSDRVRPGAFAPGERLTLAKLRALAREPGANGEGAIYWMDAGFLGELRKTALFR